MTMETKAWSYSALTSYEMCPKRYWHLNVQKDVREAKSEHQDWGTSVHSAMEKRIKSGTPLPLGMKQWEPLVTPLVNLPGETVVEQKLALDVDFQPSAWFGPAVWVRCVIDAAFIRNKHAMLIDWKTGKRKSDDDQLALMAGVVFAQLPDIETVDSAFCWLQEKPINAFDRTTFQRSDVPAIWERFLRRYNAFADAHKTVNFPPKPSGICKRFCPVKSCPYNGG